MTRAHMIHNCSSARSRDRRGHSSCCMRRMRHTPSRSLLRRHPNRMPADNFPSFRPSFRLRPSFHLRPSQAYCPVCQADRRRACRAGRGRVCRAGRCRRSGRLRRRSHIGRLDRRSLDSRAAPTNVPDSAAPTNVPNSAASTASSKAASTAAATASFRGVDHNHGRNPKSYDASCNVLEREHRNLLLLFAGPCAPKPRFGCHRPQAARLCGAPGTFRSRKLDWTVALRHRQPIRRKCCAEWNYCPVAYTIAVNRNLTRELDFCGPATSLAAQPTNVSPTMIGPSTVSMTFATA